MEEIRLDPYEVKVAVEALNCRVEPKMSASVVSVINDAGPYTIIEEVLDEDNNSWGKVEGKNGWIKLAFTERDPRVQTEEEIQE